MKTEDFRTILNDTPKYVPVFELTRVPEWVAEHGFVKGDRFYFDYGMDTFYPVITNGRGGYGFGSSAVKFIKYEKV